MPDLSNLRTIHEAATALHLAESSIRRMVADEAIPAGYATPEPIATLLQEQRIKGIPGTGVRLIHRTDLIQAGKPLGTVTIQ